LTRWTRGWAPCRRTMCTWCAECGVRWGGGGQDSLAGSHA
jgi:hypothetical protein